MSMIFIHYSAPNQKSELNYQLALLIYVYMSRNRQRQIAYISTFIQGRVDVTRLDSPESASHKLILLICIQLIAKRLARLGFLSPRRYANILNFEF